MSDQSPFNREEMPFNPLPPAVVALVLVIAGLEVIFQFGDRKLIGAAAEGWRHMAQVNFAFMDPIFEAMRANNTWPLEHVTRFLSYSMIHVSMVHALMACVFILALGKMVGEVFGNLAFMLVFTVSVLVGSLGYGLIVNSSVPLLGANPGAYGLIGSYTFILWVGLGARQENQLRAFSLIGFLLGLQLAWALIFGGDPTWVADLSGFFTGFAISLLLVPGAFPRLLEKLRKR